MTTSEEYADRHNEFFGGDKVNGDHTIFSNFWMDIWHYDGLTKVAED